MNKNLSISHLGSKGDGVAKTTTGCIYIPYTLPGEVVEASINGAQGKIAHFLHKSPARIAPVCPHFGVCGGCSLQHMEKSAYLDWKRAQIETTLQKQNLKALVYPLIAVTPGARRRAVFSFRRQNGRLVLGFHEKGSNRIFSPERCPVLHPVLEKYLVKAPQKAFAALADILATGNKEGRMLATLGNNGVSIAVSGANLPKGQGLHQKLLKAIHSFWKVCINGENVSVKADDTLQSGPFSLKLPPGAFCQAAEEAEQALISHAIPFLQKAKRCADLFSGIGTFTLHLAKHAPLLAVDEDRAALSALKESAAHAQNLKKIETLRRNLFNHPLSARELNGFDGVLLDPPRAGAKAQCEELAASNVKRIAFISCNPVTFARDAKILAKGGYQLLNVQPVDQFLYTHHVELAALFEKA